MKFSVSNQVIWIFDFYYKPIETCDEYLVDGKHYFLFNYFFSSNLTNLSIIFSVLDPRFRKLLTGNCIRKKEFLIRNSPGLEIFWTEFR